MEYQPNVHALLELSGYKDGELEVHMKGLVQSAPDPETAVLHMLSSLPVQSSLLQEKWRKYISELWFASHPKACRALNIPLTSREVSFSSALVEVYTLVQELRDTPAVAYEDFASHFLHPSEEARIARDLPLFEHDPLHVRRVCALLEELRLVRPYKGQVRVIESRYKEFQALPIPSQYYMLWHTDMYHLDWKEYFHDWGAHLVVFQQYLPMVWEMLSRIQGGESASMDELTSKIVRSFKPMWQQELSLGLYEQSLLQGALEVWLLEKVFVRYGFIMPGTPRIFVWTDTAQKMLDLERNGKLPCSTEVLS